MEPPGVTVSRRAILQVPYEIYPLSTDRAANRERRGSGHNQGKADEFHNPEL
jgi:hypothetical protein